MIYLFVFSRSLITSLHYGLKAVLMRNEFWVHFANKGLQQLLVVNLVLSGIFGEFPNLV
jgi:hypothetical protein